MIRHVFKLIWHRKRTNLLLMAEIFFSVLVLFGVGALGVYMAENWRRPIGFTPDNLWIVNVDMRVTGDDTFTASQVETMQRVLAGRAGAARGRERRPARCCRRTSWAARTGRTSRNGRRVEFGVNEVTDDFKNVLGLQIVQGRWFGREDDGASYLPVVINADMAQRALSRPGPDRQEPRAGAPAGRERLAARRRGPASRKSASSASWRRTGRTARSTGRRGRRSTASRSSDTDPSKRENRPPGNLILRMRPGTNAELRGAADQAPAGRRA